MLLSVPYALYLWKNLYTGSRLDRTNPGDLQLDCNIEI